MPIHHGTEILLTASDKIHLELKNNTVSIVMDDKSIGTVEIGDNEYQRLLAYVRSANLL
jgi:hypothetical protein